MAEKTLIAKIREDTEEPGTLIVATQPYSRPTGNQERSQ